MNMTERGDYFSVLGETGVSEMSRNGGQEIEVLPGEEYYDKMEKIKTLTVSVELMHF